MASRFILAFVCASRTLGVQDTEISCAPWQEDACNCVHYARDRQKALPSGLITCDDKRNAVNSHDGHAGCVLFRTGDPTACHAAYVTASDGVFVSIEQANWMHCKCSRASLEKSDSSILGYWCPSLGQGANSSAAYPRSMDEAAAFAKNHYENQIAVDVGLCDHYVGVWYGLAHSGFADAIAHWSSIPASYKLGGWQPGALAFWSGGSHGHVAIGDVKLGRVYSTDYPKKGFVGHKEVGEISSAWGYKFLGWTKPYFNTFMNDVIV